MTTQTTTLYRVGNGLGQSDGGVHLRLRGAHRGAAIFGPSKSGRTSLLQWIALDALDQGRQVVIFDFEAFRGNFAALADAARVVTENHAAVLTELLRDAPEGPVTVIADMPETERATLPLLFQLAAEGPGDVHVIVSGSRGAGFWTEATGPAHADAFAEVIVTERVQPAPVGAESMLTATGGMPEETAGRAARYVELGRKVNARREHGVHVRVSRFDETEQPVTFTTPSPRAALALHAHGRPQQVGPWFTQHHLNRPTRAHA